MEFEARPYAERGPSSRLGGTFLWKSDLDGVLGTSAGLLKPARELSEGMHQITLRWTIPGGASTSQRTTIHIHRTRRTRSMGWQPATRPCRHSRLGRAFAP